MDRRRPIAAVAEGKYWVNNHAHVLDPIAVVPHGYLAEFFNSVDLRERLTGIDQVKLTAGALATLPVPIPPRAEAVQIEQRVAIALSLLAKQASTHHLVTALLDKCSAALLAKAFRGELVPQDPNDEPADITLSRATTTSAEAPRQRARRPKAAE